MRKVIYSIFLSLLFSGTSISQVKDEPIRIKTFSVDIKAGLFTASTTILIELYNPNNKVLDGEYSFSLGPGQVITGFALDINGNMRKGVIVDKQKGRVAYENTIRRRIDPGLLEMTAGDNYRVRVYPMPANGTRKIRIEITQELPIKNDALVYDLPLDVKEPVMNFNLGINVTQTRQQPITNEGIIQKRSFQKQNNSYELKHDDKDIELKMPVSFRIPLSENNIICSFNNGVNKYFAAHIKPVIPQTNAIHVSSATVFWDVSGSSSKRNIPKELSFLNAFCTQKNISQLTIVTFSNTVHETRKFNLNKGLDDTAKRFLEKNPFDGGTQLGSLDCAKYESDVFMLFSDGISNYGNAMIGLSSKPVYCISSSPSADHALLKKISDKTSGRYINLAVTEINNAITDMLKVENKLLAITANKSIGINTSLPFSFTDWITISGRTNRETEAFDLLFGDMGITSKTKRATITSGPDCDSADIIRLQVMQEFGLLRKEESMGGVVEAFAKMHDLVSHITSFIVLDNLEDYIQYGIEPPPDLEAEYLKRMGDITLRRQQQKNSEANSMINNLRTSVSQYNERVSWWSKNEPLIVFEDVLKKNNEIKMMVSRRTEEVETNTRNDNDGVFDDIKMSGDGSLSEVVVTSAFGMSRQRRSLTGSVSVISSSELSGLGNMNVAQALAGRVAGVQLIERTAPGSTPQIFIRGAMSSGQPGEPLYVVDGIPVDNDIANSIAVNEIESISVLKGAQGAAIYGSRASNGAIVITRKRIAGNRNALNDGIPKYKNLDDVDYVTELKDADKSEMYQKYLSMKDSLSEQPAFYFDAAEIMYSEGNKATAIRILTNLLEIDNENHQLLRAVGYMFENWGMYKEAISVYERVFEIKEEEPQSYRDLALAYERNGESQKAVELLYASLTRNWFQYENRYAGLRSILLTEMNAIINRYKDKLDLSEINSSIFKPLPVDLRIVVDWNKDETDIDLHILEPGGEECFYSHKQSRAGGRMAEDFTQGYGPEEYEIKNAQKGKYSIRVNYYGDRYQKTQVPSFIKLTIYKNFGRPDQTVTTETIIMDNQTGKVEIGEVKW